MSDLQPTLEEKGPDLADELQRQQKALEQGFGSVLSEWGEQVALPWIASHWPRSSWPALAPSTIREKQRRHFPGASTASPFPLIQSGALFAAATEKGARGNLFDVEPFSLTFGVSGSEIEYAAAQYFGYGHIPARPWDDIEGPPLEDLDKRLGADVEVRVLQGGK